MPDAEDFLEACDALTSGKSILQILEEVKMLFSDPDCWTQYERARDANQQRVRPEDPTAESWCLEGAVAFVSNPFGVTPPHVLQHLDRTIEEVYRWDVNASDFNDLSSYERVMELLNEAIRLAQRETHNMGP